MFAVRLSATVVALISFSVGISAQSPDYHPSFKIDLPDSARSEKIWVRYTLYGSFGAYSGELRAGSDARYLEIETSLGGKIAREIRLLAWAPNCKLQRFEIPVKQSADVHVPFLCEFQPSLKLRGQLRSGLKSIDPDSEVSVTYLARWACGFFNFADCMVPQIPLATARPDAEGHFEIEIPDFSSDEVAGVSASDAELVVRLRNAKTLNPIADLNPVAKEIRSLAGGLRILSAYPEMVIFEVSYPK